jgi:RNA polymerase sigma-70 factor, ECF subfamily
MADAAKAFRTVGEQILSVTLRNVSSPPVSTGRNNHQEVRMSVTQARRTQTLVTCAAADPLASGQESTTDAFVRARDGDPRAWDHLLAHYGARLRRYAHGRLPTRARAMTDTVDVVQDVVISARGRLGRFEFRHEEALMAYLRRAVRNRIIDEIRRSSRRPVVNELDDTHFDSSPSPLDRAIDAENQRRYRTALTLLRKRDRLALMLRLERHVSYEQLAAQLGLPTPSAARVALFRALRRLALALNRDS